MIPRRSFLLALAFGLLGLGNPSAHAAEGGFAFHDEPGQYLDVLYTGKIVARYMYAHDLSTPAKRLETYKPYLQVFDAEGKAPITKGAGGVLPHHRGIYIGWNGLNVGGAWLETGKIKGGTTYDRWHMKGGDQVHQKFAAQSATAEQATFTSLVRWEGAKPEDTIIEEERVFTFRPGRAPVYVEITTASTLKAVAGETLLNPDPEHSGIHFRPADAIERDKTKFLYPVANANPQKDRGYPWFGETYGLAGQSYSIVYLSHPANPPASITSAYRDYGRIGQTWKLTIPAQGTQQFQVRFLIAAGEMLAPEVIQKAWNEYAGVEAPVPQTTARSAAKSKFTNPGAPGATTADKPKSDPVKEASQETAPEKAASGPTKGFAE